MKAAGGKKANFCPNPTILHYNYPYIYYTIIYCRKSYVLREKNVLMHIAQICIEEELIIPVLIIFAGNGIQGFVKQLAIFPDQRLL